jgi:hypothetical protein
MYNLIPWRFFVGVQAYLRDSLVYVIMHSPSDGAMAEEKKIMPKSKKFCFRKWRVSRHLFSLAMSSITDKLHATHIDNESKTKSFPFLSYLKKLVLRFTRYTSKSMAKV